MKKAAALGLSLALATPAYAEGPHTVVATQRVIVEDTAASSGGQSWLVPLLGLIFFACMASRTC